MPTRLTHRPATETTNSFCVLMCGGSNRRLTASDNTNNEMTIKKRPFTKPDKSSTRLYLCTTKQIYTICQYLLYISLHHFIKEHTILHVPNLPFCEIVNMEMLISSTTRTGSQWSILNPKSGLSANVA